LTLFNAGFLCFYNILVHPEDSKTCLSSWLYQLIPYLCLSLHTSVSIRQIDDR
jgi:hypothetical protein